MFAIQWASQNITKDNSTFISPNVEPVESLFDLDNSLFGAPPEFSYAVKKLNLTTQPLNLTQTLNLASIASFSDPASIFNPKNLYDFFASYQAERYDNLMIKFNLVSVAQADAIYNYLKGYVIPLLGNYEFKNGTKQHKSFARLITYTLNKTEQYMRDFLPGDLYSRYIGAGLMRDKKKCSDFVKRAVKEDDRVAQACVSFNFTTYEGSYPWSYAYYKGKGSAKYIELQKITNLTDLEMSNIFSTFDTGGFGKYCSVVYEDISKFYVCKNKPCTDNELAYKQFTNSSITMNIMKSYQGFNDTLFQTNSVVNWGYLRGVPLEFDYYSENRCFDKVGLTDEAYQAMTQGKYALTSYSNAINFVIDLDKGHDVDEYTEKYKTQARTLFCVLRYMTQDAFLGGILVPLNDLKVIFGSNEPMLSFLKEGNFTKGSDPSIQTHVSINYIFYNRTLVNNTGVEVYTGTRYSEKVKSVRSINGGVFINNVVPYFDGYNVTYGNINPLQANFKVKGTDGLQFSQKIKKGSHVTIFDTKKIFDVNFKYSGKKDYDKIAAYSFDLDFDMMRSKFGNNTKKNILYDGFFNTSSSLKLPLGVSAAYFKS